MIEEGKHSHDGLLCGGCGERVNDARDACPSCGGRLIARESLEHLLAPAESGEDLPEDVRNAMDSGASRIGKYVLLEKIGQGGTATVWRAWDTQLSRVVAFKLMTVTSDVTAERFRREAKAAARLSHANVVTIHDSGTVEQGGVSCMYIAMRYVEGATLDRSSLPRNEKVRVLREVADALAHAHAANLVHRDVKPRNILVDLQGKAFLADFGLAREIDAEGLTLTGVTMGTPPYMAPEQIDSRPEGIDGRADVYALGATLYEVICGKPIFTASTTAEVLDRVLRDEPLPPRKIDPSIARDLETICLKALEKDPARRYVGARELANDLDRFLKGEAIQARPAGPLIHWARRLRKHRTAMLCFAAAAAAVSLATAVWWASQPSPEPWVEAYRDDFARAELGADWIELRPEARIHDGEYCSRGAHIVSRLDFPGDIRIEFTARVMPDSSDARELSAFINGSPEGGLAGGYSFELAILDEYGKPYHMLQRLREPLFQLRAPPLVEKGRAYRVFLERMGSRLTQRVDDREVIAYEDPHPIGGFKNAKIGFGSNCDHLHYGDLRVRLRANEARKFAERCASAGLMGAAANAYRALYSVAGNPADLLRAGECLLQSGSFASVEETLRPLLSKPEPTIHFVASACIAARARARLSEGKDAIELLARAEPYAGVENFAKRFRDEAEIVVREIASRMPVSQQLDFWSAAARQCAQGSTLADHCMLRIRAAQRGLLDPGCYEGLSDTDDYGRSLRSIVLSAQGKTDQAIAIFEPVCRKTQLPPDRHGGGLRRGRFESLLYLAELYAASGRRSDARRAFEEAVSDFSPDGSGGRVMTEFVGLSLAILFGDDEPASQTRKRLQDLSRSPSTDVLEWESCSVLVFGRHESAEALLQPGRWLPETACEIPFALAVDALSDRRTGEGIGWLRRYLDQPFKGVHVAMARALLQRFKSK